MKTPFTTRTIRATVPVPAGEANVPVAPMELNPVDAPSPLGAQMKNLNVDLGFIQRMKLTSESRKQLREKLGQIGSAVMEKQREEIFQRLMLDLDINKKRAFKEYMEKVSHLNGDLVQKSNEMERNLRDTLWDEVELIFEEKRRREERLSRMNLTQDEHTAETERTNRWIDFALQQTEGKLNLLIETHSDSLSRTLQLLRDEAVDAKRAIEYR